MIGALGLIPARGGSKTVPRKNIKLLNGKPLLAYTIEAALKSTLIERLIVSTDDDEIAQIAKKYGAECLIRPKELARDSTGDLPVVKHAIEWFKRNEEQDVDKIIYLRPTTPFKTSEIIDACIKKTNENDYTGLRTVTQVHGVHHPYWMYKSDQQVLKSFCEGINIKDYYQRQLLPDCYRLNGVVDIMLSNIVRRDELYGNKIGYHEIDDLKSIDIDTEEDFDFCEYLISKSKL